MRRDVYVRLEVWDQDPRNWTDDQVLEKFFSTWPEPGQPDAEAILTQPQRVRHILWAATRSRISDEQKQRLCKRLEDMAIRDIEGDD